MRWDLTFTPEVSGHEQGHWGCCEGGYLNIEEEKEYLYNKKNRREEEPETE